MVMGLGRDEQSHSPGDLRIDQYTSVSASRDGRRVVATVANPDGRPLARAAARWAGRRTRRPAVSGADRCGHSHRASARRRCSTCPPRWDRRRPLAAQGGHALEVGRASNSALSEPPAVSRDGEPRRHHRDATGKTTSGDHGARTVRTQTLAASIDIQGRRAIRG